MHKIRGPSVVVISAYLGYEGESNNKCGRCADPKSIGRTINVLVVAQCQCNDNNNCQKDASDVYDGRGFFGVIQFLNLDSPDLECEDNPCHLDEHLVPK